MPLLVADVGGTNCRLALGQAGAPPGALKRYANRDFGDFASAARHYLAEQGNPRLAGICIAVAGPVTAGRAVLTNFDWGFDEAALTDAFGVPALLLNDLSALGHALPHLGPDSVTSLQEADRPAPNRQALILGLGTGVNTCGVVVTEGGAVPIAAEAGHQVLPVTLVRALEAEGLDPGRIAHCEALFSGRGLAELHRQRSGALLETSRLTAAAASGDPQARGTLALFARLLGLWAQEIALQSLPRDGLYLAGSVARGVIEAGFATSYTEAFTDMQRLGGVLQSIPLRLITDDMAALWGCLAAAPQD